MESLGGRAQVQTAPEGYDGWSVLGEVTIVPELAALQRIRTELDAEASLCDGEYDGWGTPVDPDE